MTRPVVIDLTYGRVDLHGFGERDTGDHGTDSVGSSTDSVGSSTDSVGSSTDGGVADVAALMDAIDAATLTGSGGPVFAVTRWQQVLAAIIEAAGQPERVVIGHPSTWGDVRAAVLGRAADSLADRGTSVSVVGRAVLIARSHTDETVRRCAVVETTHLPRYPVDPMHPATTPWDVTTLRRTSQGWVIDRSGALTADANATAVEAVIDDSVEAVFVDGADPDEVCRAAETVSAHAVAGRVVAVDRSLIARRGWRTDSARPPIAADVADTVTPTGSRRVGWGWIATAVAAVAVAVAALVLGFSHQHRGTTPRTLSVTLDRTTLTVPADWRRSEPPAPSADSDPQVRQSRTVFADRGGGRILVVQSQVRTGSTRASVAVSMGNRIRQRGDDVVTEFSASTRFAGRDVISYREVPASGAAIRWYVLVGDSLQVSIGCQSGAGGEPVDTPCERAVATTHIAPP